MNTSESLLKRNDAGMTVADRPSDRRVLRRLLLIAVVLLVIGLIVFAGFSGFAADPMTGT
jgi:hypothetical protein